MFKKLSASVFALVLVAGVFAPAQAQDTIALYFDNAGSLERFGNTGALPFTIVVGHDTVNPSSAAEFIMTEIGDQLAGIFKIGTVKINAIDACSAGQIGANRAAVTELCAMRCA